ncbi:MAG TPA: hypothetical protein P5077_09150 [bacterium]|nr:hypothetical protein [bacterium]
MKKFFYLAFVLMFAMLVVSCGDNNDPAPTDDDTPVTETETPIVDDAEVPDDAVACTLEDSFLEAMPAEWEAYFTMKMTGAINDPAATEVEAAFLAKMTGVLLGKTYNLANNIGYYILDALTTTDGQEVPAVIGVGMGNVTWPVSGKLVDVWVGQTFFVVSDLLNWKTAAAEENLTGVEVEGTYQVVIFQLWLEIVGQEQFYRMQCVRGVSAMNADETAYDGAMFVCVDKNVEWAIGETLRAMNYSKMIDADEDILAALNEGLTETDENYMTDVCTCYSKEEDEEGNPIIMNCEDMKDEFGKGELPDGDETPDDVVTDDVVTDDLLPDN